MRRRISFSADGIRGLAGDFPLNRQGCILLGKAAGNYIKEADLNPLVMVARDTRPSSSQLYHYIKYGLTSTDIQIQDLNIITTPALAYLVKNSSASLGIMITASHNPLEFNGIKIIGSDGKRIANEADFERHFQALNDDVDNYFDESNMLIPYPNNELMDKYIDDQITQADLVSLEKMNLLIDCANGATSYFIPDALKKLGAGIQAVNQFNGENSINSNCGTEYVRSHLPEFTTMIRHFNVDYGISFDGDGDRLIIVDSTGNLYNGDDFLFILGKGFLQSGSLHKNTIVTTYMANSGLISSLNAFEINVERTRNGDKYLEEQISQNNYRLGGEQFGNIMIHDNHHIAADPFYALLYLLKEMKISELSSLVQSFYKHPQILATIKLGRQNVSNLSDEQIESTTSHLGVGSRIQVWRSSTQPELFNIMVEGSHECTYESVLRETHKLCQIISGINNFESIIIPLSERIY